MPNTLFYVHDPMCSWCWGFRPALDALVEHLPRNIAVERLLGGLAPDSEEPMPDGLREQLQETWRRIQACIPGTQFDFAFWTRCTPRRSTWPACRAVIAARNQDPDYDQAMTLAIQRAYYLEARNPSDRETLIALAAEIGADSDQFVQDLDSESTQKTLTQEIAQARSMGVDSFPALVLSAHGSHWRVPLDYTGPDAMLDTITGLL
jgi:putative protein-disulfide isomerase